MINWIESIFREFTIQFKLGAQMLDCLCHYLRLAARVSKPIA